MKKRYVEPEVSDLGKVREITRSGHGIVPSPGHGSHGVSSSS